MASAVLLVVTLPVLAQSPDDAPVMRGADVTSEPLPEPTAPEVTRPPAKPPTHRPTHLPTSTAVATPTTARVPPPPPEDTATAIAVPPTPSTTPLPVSTATSTATVTAASTPTATIALVSLLRDVSTESGALTGALGAILALLAVWLGARLAGAGARIERRRARRTLATAMLLELRRIDAILRRAVALDSSASFPSLDHPIMEAALRDLTLFRRVTAARIAQFHSALCSIQHEIGDYRDNPLRWAGRLGELNQLIKGRAGTACRAVPELVKALEQEGGAPPPPLPEPPSSSAANPSGLPPPPFGTHDGDDWTL